MKITSAVSLLALLTIAFSCFVPVICMASDEEAHWSYEGEEGPEHWADISEDYHMCREGVNQSPIDLNRNIHAELSELVFDYYSKPIRETNNGHTIQVDVESGGFLKIPSRDRKFELKQFHFHSPSEHTINGQSYAMEVHFVHADDSGALAVVGVLFTEGAENSVLGKLWAFMPDHGGESNEAPIGIEETDLLPATRDYFYYPGSLTTPPCTEGVSWFVLKNSIEASAEQIDVFKKRMGHTTNRPVQPHNARLILD